MTDAELHWSDCAVNNEPALPTGPCNCEGYTMTDAERIKELEAKVKELEGRVRPLALSNYTIPSATPGLIYNIPVSLFPQSIWPPSSKPGGQS